MKRVVRAACPHDCPDACGVLITVEDGRATRIQGDPEHPVTQGFLCAKVAKYVDRVYSPDRVLYPMRRKTQVAKGGGQRGPGDFVRISWDEALDAIAAHFQAIIREFGAEAILPYSYGGNLGTLSNGTMDRRFFHRMGASLLARTICDAAGEAGIRSVMGARMGTEPEQFRHSRLIIAWGANIHGNNVHLWPFIEEARRQGARLVVIDPFKTRTARCADWHLAINPGTDTALALGMMHVIFEEKLQDQDYIDRYTTGFAELRERAREYPPEKVAKWTGIAADDIARLAQEYATTHPAVIRLNYGIQRGQYGGTAVRSVLMLPCITGSWKQVGGGLQISVSDTHNLNKPALERRDLMARPTRTINMVELGKVLNETDDPPVKALFVYNSNPAAVAPNHHAVIRGLKRPDLFTVVHEQFFTDTTDYADVLLPATTFFEHKDLQKGYGHHYIQISQQAMEPIGECRSNVETFRALAKRMGFSDECFDESVDEMIEKALASGHPHLAGITRQKLENEGGVRLNLPEKFLPFAEGNFGTPGGKARFCDPELEKLGLDPVPQFVAPEESRHSSEASRFPLELLARKADHYLNSSFCNLPSLDKLGMRDVLEMAPADAAARDIEDGDRVRVFNRRGEVFLQARVRVGSNGDGASVQPGVVAAYLGWAKLTRSGLSINALTSDRLADMGGSPTFYSTLVEVERAKA